MKIIHNDVFQMTRERADVTAMSFIVAPVVAYGKSGDVMGKQNARIKAMRKAAGQVRFGRKKTNKNRTL